MEDIPISIKEYFDTRLNEQRLYFESKFEEREKRAIDARSSAFERLDRLNEISEGRDKALRMEIRRLETALALYATVEAMQSLAAKVAVIDARFCKPVDGEMLSRVLKPGHPVLTVEDHSLQNGFGSAVLEFAVAHQLPTESITRLGMPDRLIAHASRREQLAEVGLDAAGIARSVRDAIRASQQTRVLADVTS